MTDRGETTGISMDELRDAGVEQHLRPLQDELDRIADGSPLMKAGAMSCDICDVPDVAMTAFEQARWDLHRAWHGLTTVVAQALRLEEVATWLWRKL